METWNQKKEKRCSCQVLRGPIVPTTLTMHLRIFERLRVLNMLIPIQHSTNHFSWRPCSLRSIMYLCKRVSTGTLKLLIHATHLSPLLRHWLPGNLPYPPPMFLLTDLKRHSPLLFFLLDSTRSVISSQYPNITDSTRIWCCTGWLRATW